MSSISESRRSGILMHPTSLPAITGSEVSARMLVNSSIFLLPPISVYGRSAPWAPPDTATRRTSASPPLQVIHISSTWIS
jgi:hypothetical protein